MDKRVEQAQQQAVVEGAFFLREDVVNVAREMIGKIFCTNINGQIVKGIITETEAYDGVADKACHAYNNRLTRRTSVMYRPGGRAYVYLCYGIHHLVNIIVGGEGSPKAVLLRSAEPIEGIDVMLRRRNKPRLTPELTSGPGNFAVAFGLTTSFNDMLLSPRAMWLENNALSIAPDNVGVAARVGVDYAGDHAAYPYRFYLKTSAYVTKKPKNI